jgi:putative ABC transport system substrate-binding protein
LELLTIAVPEANRIGVLWVLGDPTATLQLKGYEEGARSLHLELALHGVSGPTILNPHSGLWWSSSASRSDRGARSTFFFERRRELADLAIKARLLTMLGARSEVEAGGLMTYVHSHSDMYRRAAAYVVKILKGAKPADLPVEQPTKFELVINLKTAKALVITVPPSILARADEVIE